MRILVVEDEKNMNRLISEAMVDEGYSTDRCFDGADAVEYALAADYDVIILDVNLPKLDGFTVVERLRAQGCASPVLFLTARDSVLDKVTGLEAGGDYYLTKPFSFDELRAVVKVMARKYTGNKTNEYQVGDLVVDTSAKTVTRGGAPVDLTSKEFALLEYMIRNKGVVLSREMIENNLWNFDYEGGTNVVDVYIGYLRRKIDKGRDTKLIHTVWGTGWVLREE
ncbi:MAG: response regulator transcription factor [Mogibacterium sp.]|nr:response regulator transcription factor [Mogibacterium sp.]MBR2540058.1 response regulator transcription factor [Mogibacterium sp.]